MIDGKVNRFSRAIVFKVLANVSQHLSSILKSVHAETKLDSTSAQIEAYGVGPFDLNLVLKNLEQYGNQLNENDKTRDTDTLIVKNQPTGSINELLDGKMKQHGHPSSETLPRVAADTLSSTRRSDSSGSNATNERDDEAVSSKAPEVVRSISLNERLKRSQPIWYLPMLDRYSILNNLSNKQDGNFILSGIYDPSIKCIQSHEEQQANMVRSKSSSANTLVLFVKSKDDNDIEKINEYPIDIDEKHQLFYIRKDPVNRFKTIISLIQFYTVSDHDRAGSNEAYKDLKLKLRLPCAISDTTSLQQLISISLLEQDFWRNECYFKYSTTQSSAQASQLVAAPPKVLILSSSSTSPSSSSSSSSTPSSSSSSFELHSTLANRAPKAQSSSISNHHTANSDSGSSATATTATTSEKKNRQHHHQLFSKSLLSSNYYHSNGSSNRDDIKNFSISLDDRQILALEGRCESLSPQVNTLINSSSNELSNYEYFYPQVHDESIARASDHRPAQGVNTPTPAISNSSEIAPSCYASRNERKLLKNYETFLQSSFSASSTDSLNDLNSHHDANDDIFLKSSTSSATNSNKYHLEFPDRQIPCRRKSKTLDDVRPIESSTSKSDSIDKSNNLLKTAEISIKCSSLDLESKSDDENYNLDKSGKSIPKTKSEILKLHNTIAITSPLAVDSSSPHKSKKINLFKKKYNSKSLDELILNRVKANNSNSTLSNSKAANKTLNKVKKQAEASKVGLIIDPRYNYRECKSPANPSSPLHIFSKFQSSAKSFASKLKFTHSPSSSHSQVAAFPAPSVSAGVATLSSKKHQHFESLESSQTQTSSREHNKQVVELSKNSKEPSSKTKKQIFSNFVSGFFSPAHKDHQLKETKEAHQKLSVRANSSQRPEKLGKNKAKQGKSCDHGTGSDKSLNTKAKTFDDSITSDSTTSSSSLFKPVKPHLQKQSNFDFSDFSGANENSKLRKHPLELSPDQSSAKMETSSHQTDLNEDFYNDLFLFGQSQQRQKHFRTTTNEYESLDEVKQLKKKPIFDKSIESFSQTVNVPGHLSSFRSEKPAPIVNEYSEPFDFVLPITAKNHNSITKNAIQIFTKIVALQQQNSQPANSELLSSKTSNEESQISSTLVANFSPTSLTASNSTLTATNIVQRDDDSSGYSSICASTKTEEKLLSGPLSFKTSESNNADESTTVAGNSPSKMLDSRTSSASSSPLLAANSSELGLKARKNSNELKTIRICSEYECVGDSLIKSENKFAKSNNMCLLSAVIDELTNGPSSSKLEGDHKSLDEETSKETEGNSYKTTINAFDILSDRCSELIELFDEDKKKYARKADDETREDPLFTNSERLIKELTISSSTSQDCGQADERSSVEMTPTKASYSSHQNTAFLERTLTFNSFMTSSALLSTSYDAYRGNGHEDLEFMRPNRKPENGQLSNNNGNNFNSIRNFIFKLAQNKSMFGNNIQEFINCTLNSRETNPNVLMSNTRQFMNGIKNYLIKNDVNFELKSLIEQERANLDFTQILNIDSIIEDCLQSILLRPLKGKICILLVEWFVNDGSLISISTNIKKLNDLDERTCAKLLALSKLEHVPSATTLDLIRNYYNRMQCEYAPFIKLKYILFIVNELLASIDEFNSAIVDLANLNIEIDYIWNLANRQLLTTETIYYLTLLSSACFVLKKFDPLLITSLTNEMVDEIHSNRNSRMISFKPAYSEPIVKKTSQYEYVKADSSSYMNTGLLDIYLLDDKLQTIIACKLPVKPNSKAKEVASLVAGKFKICNADEFGLYFLDNGVEKKLRDDEHPLEIKNERSKTGGKAVKFVYKLKSANVVWPKSI